jgi:hypothetical protein
MRVEFPFICIIFRTWSISFGFTITNRLMFSILALYNIRHQSHLNVFSCQPRHDQSRDVLSYHEKSKYVYVGIEYRNVKKMVMKIWIRQNSLILPQHYY